jgi:hypothetical protein
MHGGIGGRVFAVVLAASFTVVAAPASANTADFGIAVEPPGNVKVGGHITYELSLTNSGPQGAVPILRFTRGLGATRADQGESLHTLSETASQGTCNNDGKGVICRPGNVGAGQSVSIRIALEVFEAERPKLAVQATVEPENPAADSDPNKANDHVEITSGIPAPIAVDGLPKGCISNPVTLKIEIEVGGKSRMKAIVDGKVLGNTKKPKLTLKLKPGDFSKGSHKLSIVVQAAKGPPIATLKRKFKRC